MNEQDHIEIVVPCYNEQECVRPLFQEVKRVADTMDDVRVSVLFIDDGSRDDTLPAIRALADEEGAETVRYISLARNFGKEAAIYAGLENCDGDYIVLMDADLQHPPALIPQMLEEIRKGHDCCGAKRVSRNGEPPVRSFFSRLFYKAINHLTVMNLVPGGGDFRMMTKQMVDAIVSLSERERFIKGIMSWVGFDTVWIPYHNVERYAGKTKWSFFGLAGYAWNGFVAFATTPLRAVVYIGLVITLISAIAAVHRFVRAVQGHGDRTGWTTIVILILFFGGTIITILGIIGEYLARIYLELKGRPIYITKKTNIPQAPAGQAEGNRS
ncbi:MAG: glycosyltransferase family 2 protein [Lachnospiraceae bacterium]|nr:glycosyltransferase family 2 protein [Lachnospiraceae bacterium]